MRDKIETVASAQYPNLTRVQAIEQLFSYILNSIIMDFHPEDLFTQTSDNSPEENFRAVKIPIPREIAIKFAKYLISANKKSYSNLTHELRKRIYKRHQVLSRSRTTKLSNPNNSFGYPSQ